MKRNTLYTLLLASIVAALFGACSNNKGRGASNGANMGVYPTTTCLLSPSGYSGQCNYPYGNYSGFVNYDFTLYINGLNNNYANGFCGCGQSGFPVYNNNWGLGCINSSYFQQGYNNYNSNRYLMFTWNSTGLQWMTAQQNYNSYSNNYNNTCQQSVILACDTGVQGSCGPNAVCVSLNTYGGTGYSQSGPGLCTVTQNGYNNYGGSNYPYYYKQQH